MHCTRRLVANVTAITAVITLTSLCEGVVLSPQNMAAVPHGLIVYSRVVSQEDYVDGGGRTDLFLRTVPGTDVRRLTNHRAHPGLNLGGAIEKPKFSPDGKQILFLSNYENAPAAEREMYTDVPPYPNTLLNIWLLNRTTGAIRAMTHGDWGWEDVRWSPNGRYFSAVYPTRSGMLQDSPPCDVYIFNMKTFQKQKVAHVPNAYVRTAWRPDSRHLLIETAHGDTSILEQVSCRGGNAVPLITGLKNSASDTVSPDGRYLTFLDTHGDTLHLAKLHQGVVRPILQIGKPDAAATWSGLQWSPDRRQFAVVEANGLSAMRLHIVDPVHLSNRIVATITSRWPDKARLIGWSKDGGWLIVRTNLQAEHGPLREGLSAISVHSGRSVVLASPSPMPGGFDWHETL